MFDKLSETPDFRYVPINFGLYLHLIKISKRKFNCYSVFISE